jgi:hypothetical protein
VRLEHRVKRPEYSTNVVFRRSLRWGKLWYEHTVMGDSITRERTIRHVHAGIRGGGSLWYRHRLSGERSRSLEVSWRFGK